MFINNIFKDWKIGIKKYNPSNSLPWREGMVGRGPGWWYDPLTFTLWSKLHYSTGRALSHRRLWRNYFFVTLNLVQGLIVD